MQRLTFGNYYLIPEFFVEVCTYCDVAQLTQMRRVCKSWQQSIDPLLAKKLKEILQENREIWDKIEAALVIDLKQQEQAISWKKVTKFFSKSQVKTAPTAKLASPVEDFETSQLLMRIKHCKLRANLAPPKPVILTIEEHETLNQNLKWKNDKQIAYLKDKIEEERQISANFKRLGFSDL